MGFQGEQGPRELLCLLLPVEVGSRGFCPALPLWPMLLSAPGAEAGLPVPVLSSLAFGLMLSEKGLSPADRTTLQGTEDTRAFVTIRFPVRNQGGKISLRNILRVSLTTIIHKKKALG